jgi:hypothetical protein
VASERRLRLRRRAGVGAGAGAVARWRVSRAAVEAFVGSAGGLDLARFLGDTGAFIESLLIYDTAFSAEILQDFAVDVQQRPVWRERL